MTAAGAVIDTNVLLDFWVFEDAAVEPLRAALGAGQLVALRCAATDAELASVLARPRFRLTAERQQALLADWRLHVPLFERVLAAPWKCSDARDQPFLDLAFTARALLLVTKDKALLRLARKTRTCDLRIVTPIAVAGLIVGRDRLIDIDA
jgi:predicted nucleic acid-binding protein